MAVLLVLALAPAAHAEVRVERGVDVKRVAFSGPAVAYEKTLARLGYYGVVYESRVVRQRPARRARLVARTGFTEHTGEEDLETLSSWDLSGTSLLLGLARITHYAGGPTDSATLDGGPIGGRLRRLAECHDQGAGAAPVAVWRSVGAYSDPCRRRIVVRRLDRPRAGPLLTVDRGGDIDLSGDYLAVASDRVIEVLDSRDGRSVYRVRGRFHNGNYLDERAFGVQEDGTLATRLYRGRAPCGIGWASPADPRMHIIGRAVCEADVHIGRDRIAWLRPRGRRGELVVARVGGSTRVIAQFPAATVLNRFAFDGRRVAYAVSRCDGKDTLLLRRSLSGTPWRDRDPVRCPGRVTDRSLTVARPRKAVVGVPMRCPRGCSGYFTYSPVYGPRLPFSVARGKRHARLHLDYGTADELRRRGRASVNVAYAYSDRAGRDGRQRRMTLRLRRKR